MWEYLTLFGWSFAAATVLPLGSEPAVVFLINRGYGLVPVVAVATLGNYLGACTTYALGRAFRRGKDHPLLARYGAPVLLLSWVPIVGDALVAAAGLAGIGFIPFSLWTVAGKLARYLAVAYGAELFTIE